MKIETTRDKVVLTRDEIQAVLAAHILEKTGRVVDSPGVILDTGNNAGAYAHLKPA